MVFLDYYRIHIYKAYGNLGFSICVSKMGRNKKRLGGPSALPVASHLILRTEWKNSTWGNPSPETLSDFSKVTEDNK